MVGEKEKKLCSFEGFFFGGGGDGTSSNPLVINICAHSQFFLSRIRQILSPSWEVIVSFGGQIGLETFARKLFAEAEEDEKRLGNYFCLYIAIFFFNFLHH
jgi:hypothetical protein